MNTKHIETKFATSEVRFVVRIRFLEDALRFTFRPVAQKQSARLISGRPRSVTARDDHPSLAELRPGGPFPE
jgi:hypothetical protein